MESKKPLSKPQKQRLEKALMAISNPVFSTEKLQRNLKLSFLKRGNIMKALKSGL